MQEALIIDAVRTPRGIGKTGKGALAHLHPQHLSATVIGALVRRTGIDSSAVQDVIWSTSTQKGKQGGDIGRMSALAAGLDPVVSGISVDRFCGGGISSVCLGAASVMSGMEDCVIAGGCEMMSYTAQIAGEEAAAGLPPFMYGAYNEALDAMHPQSQQGVCADAIAASEGIDRTALDELATDSQRKADIALREGRFDRSIVPVTEVDGLTVALERDEFPRPQTTLESLGQLRPAFDAVADTDLGDGVTYRKQIQRRYPDLAWTGVHHAGNSSGVVDGAAAILLCSHSFAEENGLVPRGRIVAYANIGDDPTLMLNAPGPAALKVLERSGLTKDQIDVWEINEAFAVVAEKFIRDLDLDRARVNPNGGAIALGHPIGATGTMLIGMALDELERTDGRYALITMCAAGGMAPALIIERI